MGWPKGKPRRRIEASSGGTRVDQDFVHGNDLARKGSAARHEVANSIVNPTLAMIEEKLGNDTMRRIAPVLNKLIRAAVEKGPLPGQKTKPMRPLPEHVYKQQQAAKASAAGQTLRAQTGPLA